MNLPVGIVALAVIAAAFPTVAEHVRHTIDYLGAVLLAGGLSAIVLYTSLGGTTYPWGSAGMIATLVLGVVLLAAFVFAERRAAEPILPLQLFRNRVFTVTSAVGFVVGLALFGSVTYLPLYLQDVKGAQRDDRRPLVDADDGRRPDHVDHERPTDHEVRPLPAVPDRRHRDHDPGARAPLAPRGRHAHGASRACTCWCSAWGSGS